MLFAPGPLGKTWEETELYPLELAAWRGRSDDARFLLEYGCVNAPLLAKNQPYRASLVSGNEEIAVMLIDSGIVEVSYDSLMDACAWGRARVTRTLLERGAEWDRAGDMGNRLFSHLLSMYNTVPDWAPSGYRQYRPGGVAQALIDAGAKPNRNTFLGACAVGAWQVARAILVSNKGIDMSQFGPEDRSVIYPLAELPMDQSTKGLLDLFLQRNLGLQGRDGNGCTILHYAREPKTIKYLLEEGARIDPTDRHGSTPLHYAAYSPAKVSSLETLISAGANVESRNDEGSTPLHIAARNGNATACRRLIAAGGDVNAKDGDGKTPFDLALARKDERVISLFRKSCPILK